MSPKPVRGKAADLRHRTQDRTTDSYFREHLTEYSEASTRMNVENIFTWYIGMGAQVFQPAMLQARTTWNTPTQHHPAEDSALQTVREAKGGLVMSSWSSGDPETGCFPTILPKPRLNVVAQAAYPHNESCIRGMEQTSNMPRCCGMGRQID